MFLIASATSILYLIAAFALFWFALLAYVLGWLVAATVLFEYAGWERDGYRRPVLLGAVLAGALAAVPPLGTLPQLAVTVLGLGSFINRRWGDAEFQGTPTT